MVFLFLSVVAVLIVMGPLVFLATRTYPRLDLMLQGPWFKFALRGESKDTNSDTDSTQQD